MCVLVCVGTREVLRQRFPVSGVQESDRRLSLWLEIIANFGEYQTRKRTELQAKRAFMVKRLFAQRIFFRLHSSPAFRDAFAVACGSCFFSTNPSETLAATARSSTISSTATSCPKRWIGRLSRLATTLVMKR